MSRWLAAGLVVRGKAARIRTLLKADGYRATFTAPCAGKLTLRWYFRKRRTQRRAPVQVLVARASRGLPVAGDTRLTVRLTARGRALLRRARSLKLVTTGVFTPSTGGRVSASRTVVIRR